MDLISLCLGRVHLELGARRFFLEVVDGNLQVAGDLLAGVVGIADLLDLIRQLGSVADRSSEQTTGEVRRGSGVEASDSFAAQGYDPPRGTFPRCHHESHEIFRSLCCSQCGHAWRAPLEPDDFDVAPHGDGGGM